MDLRTVTCQLRTGPLESEPMRPIRLTQNPESAGVLLAGGLYRRIQALPPARRRLSQGFTLIELILVMTLLVIAVSITAPALSRSVRARTLDLEMRRLLALSRQGQSRAVSEGVPMELWIDSGQSAFGLEAEPSFEANDTKEIRLTIEPGMQIAALNSIGSGNAPNANVGTVRKSNHPSLPRIRFLPDGSIEETSPQSIRLTGRDGSTRSLTISRNRMGYEIGGPAQ